MLKSLRCTQDMVILPWHSTAMEFAWCRTASFSVKFGGKPCLNGSCLGPSLAATCYGKTSSSNTAQGFGNVCHSKTDTQTHGDVCEMIYI